MAVLYASQTIHYLVEGVLDAHQSQIAGIRHRLCRRSRLRGGGFVARKGVSMDERMPGDPSLDLSEPDEVAPLEIPVSMLELPQR
jgi:hypothetical protein